MNLKRIQKSNHKIKFERDQISKIHPENKTIYDWNFFANIYPIWENRMKK